MVSVSLCYARRKWGGCAGMLSGWTPAAHGRFLRNLCVRKGFSVPAPPGCSGNKGAALRPLPAAQAVPQFLRQLFTQTL